MYPILELPEKRWGTYLPRMLTDPAFVLALAAILVPALLGLAAGAPSPRLRGVLGWAASLVGALFVLGHIVTAPRVPVRWFAGPVGELLAVRVDGVTAVVLGMVGVVGAVLWRFSRAYLDGDAGLPRYQRALLFTLACVTGLVVANHLLVVAACWTGTSLALHQLLTHFDGRQQAQLAAHKKFLASRFADACLLGASALLYVDLGTLSLDRIDALARAGGGSPAMQGAALLLTLCVALKSAQLPFHGWLTQVMEAPTPVSALLHAGVVNMGALVLLRLSGVLVHAPLAQTLMVLIGTTTAVVAGLVWTTRVSAKGALAWSTMAQMGFMLLQCGLGAWPLALLHLVAHSLYKAHAFLVTGSAVDRAVVARLGPEARPVGVRRWLAAGALGVGLTALVGVGLGVDPVHEPALWVLLPIVGLAVAPLLVEARSGSQALGRGGVALGVIVAYLGWHQLFSTLVTAEPGPWLPTQLALVGLGFGGGFVVQAQLRGAPRGRVAQALRPWLHHGLFLDAWFTRLTFRLWPPRLTPAPPRALHLVRTSETR